jgi:hypothetical protein
MAGGNAHRQGKNTSGSKLLYMCGKLIGVKMATGCIYLFGTRTVVNLTHTGYMCSNL